MEGMSKKLRELKGVGEKTEKLFHKLHIENTEELLYNFPRDYDRFEAPVTPEQLTAGQVAAVQGMVSARPGMNRVRNLTVLGTTIVSGGGKLPLTWFNMPFLRNTLKKGSIFVFRGAVSRKGNSFAMEQPQIYTPAQYEQILNTLQPIYGLTKGLTNNMVKKAVAQILAEKGLQEEFLPVDLRMEYRLPEENFALEKIHFPGGLQELTLARRRLVFDEFLLFLLAVRRLKEKTETAANCWPMKAVWETEEVMENLPYAMTAAQQRVWHELENDLKGHKLMSRLIQGDVGSGKTILAFLAMVMTAQNGYQAALMVPTEVLARQHFEAFGELLERQELDKCRPVLLTGSATLKEKREVYAQIAGGEASIIIGTHALIQEAVAYHSLALVITDEQHRFGVKQREALSRQGHPPHVLVMSATPIPRTLAIILYGDLDISVLDELPARRLPIKNCVVNQSYRPKAYRFIQKEAEAGRQIYVICPMVEASEGLQGENVTDYSRQLREVLPPEIKVGCLHGKMKPKEKNQVMEAFASRGIQVLVSTTVVEVGVNVPNATVMMVENAERFGLAQLHQLRGRVGRGEHQSYCIFMQGNEGKETTKRLEILNHSNDGFYIAGEDLRLRGPGDLFGIRQSGLMEFKIGDIYQDSQVLMQASEAAGNILGLDFDLELPQHRPLKKKLEKYMKESLDNLGL